MDFKWMRPTMRPPHPNEVEELSASAAEVLQALVRRFQPAGALFGRPNIRHQHQPLPFVGVSLSGLRQVTQPLSQNVPDNSCSSFFRPVPSMDPLMQPPVSSQTISSQQLPRHHQPAFEDNNEPSMEELSAILRETEATTSRQGCSSSFPSQNTSIRISPRAESNNSSPMSSFDESDIDPASSFHLAGDLYKKSSTSDRDNCGCTDKGAENETDVFKDNPVFSPVRNTVIADDNISLYDSLCSNTSLSSKEEDLLITSNSNSPKRQSACELLNTLQNNEMVQPVPFEPMKQSEDGLMFRKKIQDSGSTPTKSESPLLFSRSYSPTEELTQPSSRPLSPLRCTDKSRAMLSDCSFDDALDTEGFKTFPGDDLHTTTKILSPNVSSKQSCFRLNTPNKVRKFLGTPFKRALSSSRISMEHSKEIPAEAEKEPPGKENCEPALNVSNSSDLELSFNAEEDSTSSKPADQTFSLPFPKTPTDPKPPSYFPIFNSTQSKRKADDGTDKLRAASSASCKKKLKFMVPYRKPEHIESPSTHKKIQELAAKFAKEISDKKQLCILSEKLSLDMNNKLSQTPPQETSITLQYRGGFCQLSRPKSCTAYVPQSILLRIAWSSEVQYLSVLLERNSWSVSFLKTLFSGKARKICFEAQELIQLLVDKFHFNANEVSSQWLILDPLVGCWLLNPDEPPHSFNEVLTFLQLSGDCRGPEMLLSKLSHCAEILYEKLTKNQLWKVFLHIEMRITPILACMEMQGILVNVEKLHEMATILKGRLETVQKAAYEVVGKPFQLTSPQQLSAILYDQLKLDKKYNISVKETDKHHKSTSEAMLTKFKDFHPLPGLLLEFRSLHKHKSTYVDALLGHLSDNCIYATWDQTSAATGRITSNEPNIQNIPKQPLLPEVALRTAFIARQGFTFLAADFQHIELRVFAHLSKDGALIRALSQDIDVFKVLSQKWLQIQNTAEVCEEDRDKTKRIVYALMYGAGPSKLVEFLHIDHNQASSILQKFSGAFPKMQDFTKSTLEMCRKQGYLATETGRRRWFPHITSQNFQQRMHSERQAVNFLIQGTAADLCKCAMVHTQRHITAMSTHRTGPAARLLLQIHDELLWEVPDSNLLDVTDVVQEAMEGATSVMQSLSSFSVPLPVVIKVGKTWGDMKIMKNVSLGPSQQS